MRECTKRILELERKYKQDLYNGNPRKSVVVRKGEYPILISAPHAVNHFRDSELKYAELLTGGIAEYLSAFSDCHSMCLAGVSDDPNWHSNASTYKEELYSYIRDNNILAVIDLHGCSSKTECAIEVGTITEDYKSMKGYKGLIPEFKEYTEVALSGLDSKNIVFDNVKYKASREYNITRCVAENTDAASIQLEVNGIYRDIENDERLGLMFSCLYNLVESFKKIS